VQKSHRRSIPLSWAIALVTLLTTIAIGIWAVVQVRSGQDAGHVVSVAASAAPTFYVAILALAAAFDLLAVVGRGVPFVDALPAPDERPRLSPDSLVGYAIPIGLVVGLRIWQ
jgi:ABC-type dipeptide/oligopeptide/nickel transport system permease component